MKHIIITRINFIDDDLFQKYFTVMMKYYIPSINAQTNKNFTIGLIINNKHIQNFENLFKHNNVVFFTSLDEAKDYCLDNNFTLQTRHDCDDWMDSDYIQKIQELYYDNINTNNSLIIHSKVYKLDDTTLEVYEHKLDYTQNNYTSMFLTLIQTDVTHFVYDKNHRFMYEITDNILLLDKKGGYTRLVIHNNNQLSKINKSDIKLNLNNNYSLSVIVPTFNNIEYIDECLYSIIESSAGEHIEVLVGIDGCHKTLDYIKNKTYPSNVSFYFFEKNGGPYLIKNTLSTISKSNNLLFFDSDDTMLKGTIKEIIDGFSRFEIIKLRYQNYVDNIPKGKLGYAEGVFAISKSLLHNMNGFEPWFCAADSDFMKRLYERKNRILFASSLNFKRRVHPTSLTQRGDTGMSSRLRANYANISKNKKGSGDPEVLHIANFTQITIDTYEIPKEFDYNNIIRREKLNSVLNPTPRKTIEKPQKKQFSEPTTTRLDELFKNTSNPARIIKTNKPQNRQELIDLKNNTTKKTINELFPKKPNYKEGKNFINVGGKFKN